MNSCKRILLRLCGYFKFLFCISSLCIVSKLIWLVIYRFLVRCTGWAKDYQNVWCAFNCRFLMFCTYTFLRLSCLFDWVCGSGSLQTFIARGARRIVYLMLNEAMYSNDWQRMFKGVGFSARSRSSRHTCMLMRRFFRWRHRISQLLICQFSRLTVLSVLLRLHAPSTTVFGTIHTASLFERHRSLMFLRKLPVALCPCSRIWFVDESTRKGFLTVIRPSPSGRGGRSVPIASGQYVYICYFDVLGSLSYHATLFFWSLFLSFPKSDMKR